MSAAQQYGRQKSRGMSRGMGASRQGGEPRQQHSRGFGGFNRGFGGGGRGAGMGAYGGGSQQYGMMRRGSTQGDSMTIKCDTYARTGHMGGTMSFQA